MLMGGQYGRRLARAKEGRPPVIHVLKRATKSLTDASPHLRRKRQTRRRVVAGATPGERRVSYDIAVQIGPAEKKKLQARARADMRSVSSYVTKLVIEDLHRR